MQPLPIKPFFLSQGPKHFYLVNPLASKGKGVHLWAPDGAEDGWLLSLMC